MVATVLISFEVKRTLKKVHVCSYLICFRLGAHLQSQLRIKEQKRARRHNKVISDLNEETVEIDTSDFTDTNASDDQHLIPMQPIGSKHQYAKLTLFELQDSYASSLLMLLMLGMRMMRTLTGMHQAASSMRCSPSILGCVLNWSFWVGLFLYASQYFANLVMRIPKQEVNHESSKAKTKTGTHCAHR